MIHIKVKKDKKGEEEIQFMIKQKKKEMKVIRTLIEVKISNIN